MLSARALRGLSAIALRDRANSNQAEPRMLTDTGAEYCRRAGCAAAQRRIGDERVVSAGGFGETGGAEAGDCTFVTVSVCPSSVRRSLPVLASQMRMVWLFEAVAIETPSGDQVMQGNSSARCADKTRS